MSTQVIALSADALQAWSNDPEGARSNLRAIFSGLRSDESMVEWASEALENCGLPRITDLEFLAQSAQDDVGIVAYWACKLIFRLGDKANTVQETLAKVMLSEKVDQATRQQAAMALGAVGTLTVASRDALQKATRSNDPRLVRISTQALGSQL